MRWLWTWSRHGPRNSRESWTRRRIRPAEPRLATRLRSIRAAVGTASALPASPARLAAALPARFPLRRRRLVRVAAVVADRAAVVAAAEEAAGNQRQSAGVLHRPAAQIST